MCCNQTPAKMIWGMWKIVYMINSTQMDHPQAQDQDESIINAV